MLNRFFSLRNVALAVTLLFVFCSLELHFNSAWQHHFAERDVLSYSVYHACRIIFIACFSLISYFIGDVVVTAAAPSQMSAQVKAHQILVRLMIGFSVLTISGLLLGLLHLYYYEPILLIFTVLMYKSVLKTPANELLSKIKGCWTSISIGQAIPYLLLIGLLLTECVFILSFRGLNLDHAACDPLSHYLPSFSIVLENHGLSPGVHFLQYFYSKGAGAHFLAMVLSDAQSFQGISYLYLLCTAGMMFSLLREICPNSWLWPLAASCLWLGNPIIVECEFQKPHITIGANCLFVFYFYVYSILSRTPEKGILEISPMIVGVAAVTLAPPSLIFLVPFLIVIAVLFVLFSIPRARYVLFNLTLVTATGCLIFLINFQATGLFEFSPHRFWINHRNDLVVQQWISPEWLDFYVYIFGSNEGGFSVGALLTSIRAMKFSNLLNSSTLLIPDYILLAGLIAPGASSLRVRLQVFIVTISAAGIIAVLLAATVQTSAARFFWFNAFFSVFLFAALAAALGHWLSYVRFGKFFRAAPLILVCCAAIGSVANTYRADRAKLLDSLKLIVGKKSFQDLYGYSTLNPCYGVSGSENPIEQITQFQNRFDVHEPIVVMNWFYYAASGHPKWHYDSPFMCAFLKNAGKIVFGGAEKAAASLKETGIKHFIVDTSKPLGFLAFSELFDDNNVRRFFQVADRQGPHIFLLEWNATGVASRETEEFAGLFSKRKSEDRLENSLFARLVKDFAAGTNSMLRQKIDDLVSADKPLILIYPSNDFAGKSALVDSMILDQNSQVQSCNAQSITNKSISATFNASGDGWMYCHMLKNRNWSAEVNGQVVPIDSANGQYMAVPFVRGENTIKFIFRSRLQWFFCVGLALGACVLVLLYRKYFRRTQSK